MLPPAAGKTMEFPIIRYTGKSKKPQWVDEEPGEQIDSKLLRNNSILEAITGKFKIMSHISVDASKAPCIPAISLLGFPIFIQEFEVIYIYGQTEFKAQVIWTEEVCLSQTNLRTSG